MEEEEEQLPIMSTFVPTNLHGFQHVWFLPQYESEEFIMSDGGKGAVGFKSAVVKLKDYPNSTLPLQNTGADGTLTEVDDMVDLPYLHEVSLACRNI
jgi:hypothetical protein